MKKLKFGIASVACMAIMMTFGLSNQSTAQEVIECNWSLDECHRVVDNGHTYVYHGKKEESDPQIN